MSFLDLFKSENKQRNIYGVSHNLAAIKVLIISHLWLRVTDIDMKHRLVALYQKYNRGSSLVSNTGAGSISPGIGGGAYLTETLSRVISIDSADLSGVGTFEEQIINSNNLSKAGEDAEVWVEVT